MLRLFIGVTLVVGLSCAPSGSSTPPSEPTDPAASETDDDVPTESVGDAPTEAASEPEPAVAETPAPAMQAAIGHMEPAPEGVGDEGALGNLTAEESSGPVPRVTRARAQVKGALDPDDIKKVVRAHLGDVRACYNEQLSQDPQLAGRTTVQLTIGPDGKVEVAVVAEVRPGEQPRLTEVGECAATRIRQWEFPKPKGGGRVVVTYPFVFAPG